MEKYLLVITILHLEPKMASTIYFSQENLEKSKLTTFHVFFRFKVINFKYFIIKYTFSSIY